MEEWETILKTDVKLDGSERIAVAAAYLSPFVGFPLVGPWVLHAAATDASKARPHVARAFDVHLMSTGVAIVLAVVTLIFFDVTAVVGVLATAVAVAAVADVVLLIGALRGGWLSSPWDPIFLGSRKFYHQEPHIR